MTDGRTEVQFRYQGKLLGADIRTNGENIDVRLDEPCEIVTPGQFAVFYSGDLVTASGVIRTIRLLP
jgi:tRNA U34 2-thiouridine synthase MnmA/TrmU